MKFPFFKQLDMMDCGPTCLRMLSKYYGKSYNLQKLRDKAQIGRDGVSLLGISEAAENIGFKTLAVTISFEKFKSAHLPCIVHWNQNHFVVVYKILSKGKTSQVYVADPARGLITYSQSEFESRWATTTIEGERCGITLLIETTPRFYEEDSLFQEKSGGLGLKLLSGYLFRYKKLIIQLLLGLLIGSILQLILPFLTQSIVDVGIQTKNLHFINMVLLAQLMLFLGRVLVEFIRSWILLHISTRVNISILSDFLIKLLKLPISFFESKTTGDILQRINDHHRIEQFLTVSSLQVIFSIFNLVVFSFVLAHYSLTIYGIFIAGSIFYTLWIIFFLRFRRQLDNKRFSLATKNQNSLIQLVNSVPEMKLNNAEIKKRWEWETIQAFNFKLSVKSLSLQQYQATGAIMINEGKNIFISFMAAALVVKGQMTLGEMLAMQYIIGQLNSPVEQLIQFIQHWQDAKISLERLNEIHEQPDEESSEKPLLNILPESRDVVIKNVSFTYPGAGNEPVLKNLNLTLPQGKVTAIVGTSGSGKTTLLKLLLKYFKPQAGEIFSGNTSIDNISHKFWRSKCGTVMQDGYIFSDSIANNIAISDEQVNIKKLLNAVRIANIQSFVEELPLSYNTRIGIEGNGISQGQRQRMLIARAVYKNPQYLFFDEATNSLDANNESVIMRNLEEFFHGRTVVIVAHRLSTVKNADKIVVLEKGELVEEGSHHELIYKQGKYYELVKNQLELGISA